MLLDIHDTRLHLMDECDIDPAVPSLLSPGIQSLHDAAQAVDWAQQLNDYAAKHVAHRPDRFASFAALPMQDPAAATTEIRRAVTELGLVGALVNGFSPSTCTRVTPSNPPPRNTTATPGSTVPHGRSPSKPEPTHSA
ncbi:amidohydrolase family protein [Rhodococcus wratislaviensis]|uniref:amidohydrolase family protein n=1 Tax=Rhodococcus wratislaviensis TaxID=44752 RepID=UPI0036474A8C